MRIVSIVAGLLIAAMVGAFFVYTPLSSIVVRGTGWYGNWLAVALSIALLSSFFLAFLKPLHERNWRHLGLTEAYIVALFTEMYGIPLTIYLLTSAFGFSIGLGGLEGHLWATMLSGLGLLGLEDAVILLCPVVSGPIIATGILLMALGWRSIYRSKGLVSYGLYRYMRHPQYLGLILVLVGFLIQWPTLLTMVMFPALLAMYYKLARKEEGQLIKRYGEPYIQYMKRTPMFLPKMLQSLRAATFGPQPS